MVKSVQGKGKELNMPIPASGGKSSNEITMDASQYASALASSSVSGSDIEFGDEDGDEDDDEEEGEDTEMVEEEKSGIDEQFLNQLLAMDPLFASETSKIGTEPISFPWQTGQNHQSPLSSLKDNGDIGNPVTSQSSNNLLTPSAQTPSNEFYDGAINLLTEVLGSSDASMWMNGGATPTTSGAWNGLSNKFDSAPGARETPPTAKQYRNIQPLIRNLIARLKGHSVEESENPPRISEEDLVVLLQSLMAQRQAQLDKHTQDPSGIPKHSQGNTRPATRKQRVENSSRPGMSIVDFDFGDDDDDPDFVPQNVDLEFGKSKEFADALASVANHADTNVGQQNSVEHVNSNEEVWQHVLDSFGNSSNTSPHSNSQAVRRTRSATRTTDMSSSESQHLEGVKHELASNSAAEEPHGAFPTGNQDQNDASTSKKPKGVRKKLSDEEALARRRQANRECARRQRERKRQEAEELRRELERIHAMSKEGQEINEKALDATLQSVEARKPGRPLGSKNRQYKATKVESNCESEELPEVQAENRILCAEVHRLKEENTSLRARLLRLEGFFETEGIQDLRSDLRKRKRQELLGISKDEASDQEDERNRFLEEAKEAELEAERSEDVAASFLAYNPFRSVLRNSIGRQPPNGKEGGRGSPYSTRDKSTESLKMVDDSLGGRTMADVAAELASNPRAVESLIASLRQSARNSPST